MKRNFSCIEKGDTLYIVYKDLNKNYQIGKATVTGFHHWTYSIGDRWETWGEKDQTNIQYEFKGVQFSRNLEYCLKDTHFKDSPIYSSKYDEVFSDRFVDVFINYDDAKDFIISYLNLLISRVNVQVAELQLEQELYIKNLNEIEKS